MPSLVVGTAGHIDHGKSALVRALTGIDPDRLKEEKARGITIDLGFAHASWGDVDVAFVDVPGHERFVRNMLAGAGGLDAVLLIIAADESVMPQTREHFEICRLLGIDRGAVVITKTDLVDADTVALVSLEAAELVAGSGLADAPIVPVSARTGEGLDALIAVLQAMAGGPASRPRRGLARLPVDRVFSVKGFGTVVTGTLVSGRIAETDDLEVQPSGRAVRVRGVQVHGSDVPVAEAPRRVAVNLGAIDAGDLARGVTLASPESLSITRRIDVEIELLTGARPLKHGARVRLHQGTSDVLARASIAAIRTADADRWQPSAIGERDVAVPAGARAFLRLRLARPCVVTRGDRIVLRAPSPATTIGGGVVLDPASPAGGVRRAAALARFVALAAGDPTIAASVWLEEAGGRGLEARDLVRRGGLDVDEARARLDVLVARGAAVSVDDRWFARSATDAVGSAIRARLAQFHAEQPLDAGMPREALREQAARMVAPPLFSHVAQALASEGLIVGTDRVALATHRPRWSQDDLAAQSNIAALIDAAGLLPPTAAGLSESTGLTVEAVERAVQKLVKDRRVVRVETLLVSAAALDDLKRRVQALGSGARLDVAAFKEQFGLSRKFAIPFLEYLDRARLTRRQGDTRIVI